MWTQHISACWEQWGGGENAGSSSPTLCCYCHALLSITLGDFASSRVSGRICSQSYSDTHKHSLFPSPPSASLFFLPLRLPLFLPPLCLSPAGIQTCVMGLTRSCAEEERGQKWRKEGRMRLWKKRGWRRRRRRRGVLGGGERGSGGSSKGKQMCRGKKEGCHSSFHQLVISLQEVAGDTSASFEFRGGHAPAPTTKPHPHTDRPKECWLSISNNTTCNIMWQIITPCALIILYSVSKDKSETCCKMKEEGVKWVLRGFNEKYN